MVAPEPPPSDDAKPEAFDAENATAPSDDAPLFDPQTDETALELNQFLDDALQTAQKEGRESQEDPSSRMVVPPGPGLPESIFWMFGVFGAHLMGLVVFMVGAIIILFATTNLRQDPEALRKTITTFADTHKLEAAGVEQAVFVLIGLIAVGLRLGKRPLKKLNLQSFSLSTGILLLMCVLPLSMLSGEFYRISFDAWSSFADQIPMLKRFNELQTMEIVKDMAAQNSLWTLILVIAVFPAIGEEIIFRGMIGRGLIARWGLIPGIIITSIMFGIVHTHPAHIIAVIPLGMFMHYVYYVTRSFWAPVLVHFMNNAFAVTVTKMSTQLPEEAAKLGDETQAVPFMILLSAALLIGFTCVYLWKTRVMYITPEGNEWTPGYPSNEQPPANSPITSHREKVSGLYYAGLAFLLVNFILTLAAFSAEQTPVSEFITF